MGQGWISLHRQILDNELWEDKPFAKGQAWVDLLLLVNHEPKKIVHGNSFVFVGRGSTVTSIRKLSERWGWSRHKVVDFLDLLQNAQMAKTKRDTKKTVITIVNYSFFQDEQTKKGHQRDTKGTQKDTNNNDNNENNNTTTKNAREAELGKAITYFMDKLGMPSGIATAEMPEYVEALTADAVMYAIDKAIDARAPNWNYVRKILSDWQRRGIKNKADAMREGCERDERERSKSDRGKSGHNKRDDSSGHHKDDGRWGDLDTTKL